MQCVDSKDPGSEEMIRSQLPICVENNVLDKMKTFFETIAKNHKLEILSQ